jgi:branched-chain amino acid transport system ATP-binding protein
MRNNHHHAAPPIIELTGVSKRFGAVTAIDDLSFTLAPGEALGIVGPNGAGKTTTLNLIAGDYRPSRGHIFFCGNEISAQSGHYRCRAGIGRTSQVPRPFERLTVFENVLVGASYGARGQRQAAVEGCRRALRTAGMLSMAGARAGELTLLERKRLELARALATDPSVLLLDDVADGLTEAEVQKLVDTVRSIHAGGMSIIWVEHVVPVLLRAVDRMLALDDGRKVLEGDPRDVMEGAEIRYGAAPRSPL